jgi:hypothetical protein
MQAPRLLLLLLLHPLLRWLPSLHLVVSVRECSLNNIPHRDV